MSKLTGEELREACEMAGLGIVQKDAPLAHQWIAKDGRGHDWINFDPALPSYVAELLVAMVGDRGHDAAVRFYILIGAATDESSAHHNKTASVHLATATQRIRAAMSVLKELGE